MKRLVKYKVLLAVILLLFFKMEAKAQSTDYKFQSMFIFNFTKYIDWPQNYKNSDFVIGVIGSKSVVSDLQLMTNDRKVSGQKIIIERYSAVNDISRCHVLFFTESSLVGFATVLERLKNTPTLIITEKEGLLQKGSYINFISVGGKMKFEINEEAIQKSGLKIDNTLVGLAVRN